MSDYSRVLVIQIIVVCSRHGAPNMANNVSGDIIDRLLALATRIAESHCCCGLCGSRINMLEKMGFNTIEKYSLLEAKLPKTRDGTIIVPDDAGCFVTRVLEGFGSVLTCIGVDNRAFNAVIFDREYHMLGETRVEYREIGHVSYYYTKDILVEHHHIVIPRDVMLRVEGHYVTGGVGFRDMLAQAMGLYLSKTYGYNLVIVYRSIITLEEELKEAVIGTPIVIGSRKLYNRIQDLLDQAELVYIPMENNKVNLSRLQEIVGLLGKRDKFKKA